MEKLRFTFIVEDQDDGEMKFETFAERKIASGWLKQDFNVVKRFDISGSPAMKFTDMISDFISEKLKNAGIMKC